MLQLTQFIEAEYGRMLGYCRNHVHPHPEAEDVLHAAIAKSYAAVQRGSGPEPERVGGWMWSVLRTTVIDHARDHKRRRHTYCFSDLHNVTVRDNEHGDDVELDDLGLAELGSDHDNPAVTYLRQEEIQEAQALVQWALQSLTESQQTVMRASLAEERWADTARQLNMTYGQTKALFFRGKQAMRERLERRKIAVDNSEYRNLF